MRHWIAYSRTTPGPGRRNSRPCSRVSLIPAAGSQIMSKLSDPVTRRSTRIEPAGDPPVATCGTTGVLPISRPVVPIGARVAGRSLADGVRCALVLVGDDPLQHVP